jgi:hypothetical protein
MLDLSKKKKNKGAFLWVKGGKEGKVQLLINYYSLLLIIFPDNLVLTLPVI